MRRLSRKTAAGVDRLQHLARQPWTCLAMVVALFAGLAAAARPLAADIRLAGIDEGLVRAAGHLLIYGGIAALMARGLAYRLLTAWLLTAALGAAEELNQMFVPGRTCSAGDWLIDMAGAAAAIGLIWVARRWRPPNPSPPIPVALPRSEPAADHR